MAVLCKSLISAIIVASVVIRESDGCYIRNCPLRGKKSGARAAPFGLQNLKEMELPYHATKNCPRCGPSHSGQCLGPTTCCSALGCYFGADKPQTFACQLESSSDEPCKPEGKPCGLDGSVCVNNYCCSDDNCVKDNECIKHRLFEELFAPRIPPSLSSLRRQLFKY